MLRALAAIAACGATVLVAAPAGATEQSLTTSYECDASNPVIGSLGSGTAAGTVTVDLPAKLGAGTKLRARPITFTIEVPADMVDQMRAYSVDSIDGSSSDATYRIRKVGGTTVKEPITGLTVPQTAVPESGGMTIVGTGRASAHTFKKPGTYNILVPKAFSADGTAYGTTFGDQDFSLACTLAADAAVKVASIKVVR